jgi:cell division transport system permease protein
MRARVVLSGTAQGIRRNVTMTVALVLSTAIALAFVGASLLANVEITQFRNTYEDKLNVQVYLCTDLAYSAQVRNNDIARGEHAPVRPITCQKNQKTSQAQIDAIRAKLASDPRVASFDFISEQRALQLGKKQLPDQASFFKLGTFPASFSVKLKDITRDYGTFAADYDQIQGVDKVNNQIDTIRALLSLIDGARKISLAIALVVLIASILLIGNAIQVAAAQRRTETEIMQLVGASRWMTELPFMLEAIIAAAVGGLIAVGLTAAGKVYLFDHILANATARGTIPDLNANDILLAGGAGLAVGIVLSAITAFITLRAYVKV